MTLDEAKELYITYNCSLYAMAREAKDRYIVYKELGIDNDVEQNWRNECIQQTVLLIKRTGDGSFFNQLYELSVSFYDNERLDILMSVLGYIDFDNPEISLCIAETLIGRKKISVRSGMIFWAWEMREYDKTLEIIEKVESIIKCKLTPKLQERKIRIIKKLDEIKKILDCEMQRKD